MLLVYPYNGGHLGMNIFGSESPLFGIYPTAFGMRINNLLFINGSTDYLLAPRAGFPYPKNAEAKAGGNEYSVRELRVDKMAGSPMKLGFFKPSMGFGQVINSGNVYMKFQEIYQKSLFEHGGSFGEGIVKSKIIRFKPDGMEYLKENACIDFGQINFKDAKMAYRILNQAYEMCEYFFLNQIAKPQHDCSLFLEAHRKVKKQFLRSFDK